MHERSHSDTPTPLPSVALSAESSSVTSLSNLPLRKTLTSGKSKFSPVFFSLPLSLSLATLGAPCSTLSVVYRFGHVF